MPFQIVRNDITKMKVDAIVNAANTALQQGGGVCGAIFATAGATKLQAECDCIGHCATGEAIITKGYDLPARHIIHTAGPVWQGGSSGEERLLRNCYINSLRLAEQNGCESVAFPLISSGIYGYPKRQAMQVAISAIGEFLQEHDMTAYLVVFDPEATLIGEKRYSSIEKYIDDHYVEAHSKPMYQRLIHSNRMKAQRVDKEPRCDSCAAVPAPRSLEDVLGQMEETFSEMLLRLIDEKGMTDVEVYKRANMDRKLFSKIRSNRHYNPGKPTVLALAVALRLSLDETLYLLRRAGYTLSHSSRFDLIVEYFIDQKDCDIYRINEALFDFGQPLL